MRQIIALLCVLMIVGCRSQKIIERTDSRDSVLTEYRESIIYVPVITYIDIPAQTAERETRDSSSHLETDFATSDATIRWQGGVPILFHSLSNKPQRIENADSVPVRQKYFRIKEDHYRTKWKTKVLEKRLTLYQRAMLNLGPWLVVGLIIYSIYVRARYKRRKQ